MLLFNIHTPVCWPGIAPANACAACIPVTHWARCTLCCSLTLVFKAAMVFKQICNLHEGSLHRR